MKIYKIDGREDPIEVFTEEEERDFLEEAKSKNLKVNLQNDNSGNQKSPANSANAGQKPTAQNPYLNTTEFNLDNISSELAEEEKESKEPRQLQTEHIQEAVKFREKKEKI